jgi:hypothetical protein
VGPYIDRCVPFQIMSNQLNLPKVESNQVVDHLGSISRLIAKGLNTEYLCKEGISVVFKIIHLQKNL